MYDKGTRIFTYSHLTQSFTVLGNSTQSSASNAAALAASPLRQTVVELPATSDNQEEIAAVDAAFQDQDSWLEEPSALQLV
jgi:hypothetical protein